VFSQIVQDYAGRGSHGFHNDKALLGWYILLVSRFETLEELTSSLPDIGERQLFEPALDLARLGRKRLLGVVLS
jgi:hypothetical protein